MIDDNVLRVYTEKIYFIEVLNKFELFELDLFSMRLLVFILR